MPGIPSLVKRPQSLKVENFLDRTSHISPSRAGTLDCFMLLLPANTQSFCTS